ncbi:MAG: hydroxymethylbilane synthase [Alphaproteobacteria bacterium]|nr:hydroxymethylbilane synthase [Alphaproteobacteria bacterium]
MKKNIRIGTRGSPLALLQAEEIRTLLYAAYPGLQAEADLEIVPIRTTGDWRPEHLDRRFIDMGGNKSLFTKEIEDALLEGHVDIATHSVKDIASILPDGLGLAAVAPRMNPCDAFIGRDAQRLEDLPEGAVVGTSSLRRQAQILAQRPDLRTVPLRGNVETRLKKLEDGKAAATILAVAGLERIGLEKHVSSVMPVAQMLPAAGQGALGVQIRTGDEDMRAFVAPINDKAAATCITAERAAMRAIEGSCQTPAGAYATLDAGGGLVLEALVARADGTGLLRLSSSGTADDAEKIGDALGKELRHKSPPDLFPD